MADLFERDFQSVRILDAGAGAGVLFTSLIEILLSRKQPPKSIKVVAYENDEQILPYLWDSINYCEVVCTKADINFTSEIRTEDFIKSALSLAREKLFTDQKESFTHVILNPPYKKINKESETNVPGFYAAGDVTDREFKQAITGVSEGVSAAYSAYQHITKQDTCEYM